MKDNAFLANHLREKSVDQLQQTLLDLKKEAFNIRFQRASDQFENTNRIRQVRRATARVLTILNETKKQNNRSKSAESRSTASNENVQKQT